MRQTIIKRLEISEGQAASTTPMVICCPCDGNVKELVTELNTKYGPGHKGSL